MTEEKSKMLFGEQLQETKEVLNLSYRKLGEITGVSASYLNKIVKNKAEFHAEKKQQIIEGIGKYVTENNLNLQLSILEGFSPLKNQDMETLIYLEITKSFDNVSWKPEIVLKTLAFTEQINNHALSILEDFTVAFYSDEDRVDIQGISQAYLIIECVPEIVKNIMQNKSISSTIAKTLAFIHVLNQNIKPEPNKPVHEYLEIFLDQYRKKKVWPEEILVMNIKDKDLKIETYCPGLSDPRALENQSNGVKITHIPTGVIVSSHTTKSQIKNKEECLKLLKHRLNSASGWE